MKNNPYIVRLRRFLGQETMMLIQRDGCGDLWGQIKKVTNEGCLILVANGENPSNSGGRAAVFVALKDIRGVGHIPVTKK